MPLTARSALRKESYMKRVKYLAVALPAAVGLAAPVVAATTTATAATPATHGKKVAYPRVSQHQHIRLDATSPGTSPSSSTSPGASSGTSTTSAQSVPVSDATRPCNAKHHGYFTSPRGHFRAKVFYSQDVGCVGEVKGNLFGITASGYEMHVHYYDKADGLFHHSSFGGHTNAHSISYKHSGPGSGLLGVARVCETIWHSGIESYGPVCENV
jgi:hypothetical protein